MKTTVKTQTGTPVKMTSQTESNHKIGKVVFVGLLYALTLLVMLALPALSHAASGKDKNVRMVKREAGNAATKLSTSMAFSGSRVGGQYQVPSEATAKIENEKPIEELLGLRTQFRDRMKQDEERN